MHLPVAPVSLVEHQTQIFASEVAFESLSSPSMHSIHPLGICTKATWSKYSHVHVCACDQLHRIIRYR